MLFLIMGRTVFVPLVFALFFSILLYPLNKILERRMHLGRMLAALFTVLIFITCLSLFIYFFTNQIASFAADYPELKKRIVGMIGDLQQWFSKEFHVNVRQQTDYINKSTAGIIGTLANSVSDIFLSFASFSIWLVFMFFYIFFILFYRKLLLRFVLSLFQDHHGPKVYEVVTETRTMVYSYILGLLIEMVIVGTINCTIFSIMGIKYALFLGVLAAVFNIIPYIGIYSATVLVMLVTVANSTGSHALWAGFALLMVHFVDANIMMPRIVGARVKMNAFITIIAVILGNFTWGIAGMFLFIPITGILKIVSERVDGMQPWAILIGDDAKEEKVKKKAG